MILFLKYMKRPWRGGVHRFDDKIILISHHLTSSILSYFTWLDQELALIICLMKLKLTSAIFWAHLVQIEGQVLTTEDMIELDGCTIG